MNQHHAEFEKLKKDIINIVGKMTAVEAAEYLGATLNSVRHAARCQGLRFVDGRKRIESRKYSPDYLKEFYCIYKAHGFESASKFAKKNGFEYHKSRTAFNYYRDKKKARESELLPKTMPKTVQISAVCQKQIQYCTERRCYLHKVCPKYGKR